MEGYEYSPCRCLGQGLLLFYVAYISYIYIIYVISHDHRGNPDIGRASAGYEWQWGFSRTLVFFNLRSAVHFHTPKLKKYVGGGENPTYVAGASTTDVGISR